MSIRWSSVPKETIQCRPTAQLRGIKRKEVYLGILNEERQKYPACILIAVPGRFGNGELVQREINLKYDFIKFCGEE